MTATTSNAAATACPNITEEQVCAFIRAQAVRLGEELANGYVSVAVSCVTLFGENRVEWTTYAYGSSHIHKPTLGEAIAAQVVHAGPQMTAERLRQDAAKLIQKAELLEDMAATRLPSDVKAEEIPEGRLLPGKSTNIHE